MLPFHPVTACCTWSRWLVLALLAGVLTLGGCATHDAANPAHYGSRSSDVEAVDVVIEKEVEKALSRADGRLADARIRPHSYNGVVLLVGQVPSQELRTMAGSVTRDIRGVEDVHNELTVAARLPAGQRLTDSWLTTNVISQLATNERIDSSRLKVTTENASVYLMGIVTRTEADRIVDAVSSVRGIQRIVKVFEYMK